MHITIVSESDKSDFFFIFFFGKLFEVDSFSMHIYLLNLERVYILTGISGNKVRLPGSCVV